MKERVVFDHTMESLLRVLGQFPTPEQLSGLAALGVEPNRPLLPAYPVDTYTAVMDFITRQRWPHLSQDEAGFELGRAFMQGYRQTLMGKAVFSVTKLLGPRRSLERMHLNFRSGNNFTETRLQRVGPSTCDLWINPATRPGFYRGLLTEALEKTGARGLEVRLLVGNGGDATFRLTWEE